MGGPREPLNTEEGPTRQRARLGQRPGDEKHAVGAPRGGCGPRQESLECGGECPEPPEASLLVPIKSSGGRGGPRASDPRRDLRAGGAGPRDFHRPG